MDFDDIDEETKTLISESLDMADELIALTVQDELAKTKHSVLKDLENEMENYGKQIANYTVRLQRLELLEQGMLHRLNGCSALAKEFDQLTESYQEVFQKLYGFREELEALEESVGDTVAMVSKEDNQEVVQTLSHLKRKTSKVMQDMESLLGLNSMHKQTVIGFSNKIYYDEQV
ncbi:hypothetical protein quinque_007775 [Culex quinquefasciatus]